MELKHKAYWLLNELDEIRNDAYENSKIHKEKFKEFHDNKILREKNLMLVKKLCFIILDSTCFLES
jgi:hypothetical protein